MSQRHAFFRVGISVWIKTSAIWSSLQCLVPHAPPKSIEARNKKVHEAQYDSMDFHAMNYIPYWSCCHVWNIHQRWPSSIIHVVTILIHHQLCDHIVTSRFLWTKAFSSPVRGWPPCFLALDFSSKSIGSYYELHSLLFTQHPNLIGWCRFITSGESPLTINGTVEYSKLKLMVRGKPTRSAGRILYLSGVVKILMSLAILRQVNFTSKPLNH